MKIQTQLITQYNLPFTFPTWQTTDDLFYAIPPEAAQLCPRCSTTTHDWIIRSFKSEENGIQIALQQVLSKIHITLDLWTSPNGLRLQGIIAHRTDKHSQLTKALLSIDEIKRAHSGEHICDAFLQVANEYEIQDKLGFLVIDNASNNNTFLEYLEVDQQMLRNNFKAQERRLRFVIKYINKANDD